MRKYKVILQLMLDPSSGDQTVERTYIVDATNEGDAYNKAVEAQGEDKPEYKYLTTFDYTVKEII